MRRHFKKIASFVMTISMVVGTLAPAFADTAVNFTDTNGHWAESQITEWAEEGLAKGYQDGSFKPENSITRAEFMALVNRSYGFTEKAEVGYKDVKSNHWAYNEFKVAEAAGYIGGYEDGTLRPNGNITRQEMAAMVARLAKLESAVDSQNYLALEDLDTIPQWSAGVVSAVVDAEMVNLIGGSFKPAQASTRAEVVYALDNSLLSKVVVSYDKAGTYTAGTVKGSLAINAKDVVLEDTIVKGDLIIGEKVGEGDVTLKNVTVEGRTIVRGGGMNTIIVENSNIVRLIVEKKDGKVRILAVGDTYVDQVNLKSGAKLESKDAKAENFGSLVVEKGIAANQSVIIAASFDEVEVRVVNGNIEVLSGTIDSLVIDKSAEGVKINLAAGVVVKEATVDAKATIEGKGKIEKAIVSTNDATITVPVDKTEGKPAEGGGGGGGGGSSSGGGSTVTTKTYTFHAVYGKNTRELFTESYLTTQKMDFNMISKSYDEVLKVVENHTTSSMLKDLLKENMSYVEKLANDNTTGLKALGKLRTEIKDLIEAGKSVEEHIGQLVEELKGEALSDILEDLDKLSGEDGIQGVEVNVINANGGDQKVSISNAVSEANRILGSQTIESIATRNDGVFATITMSGRTIELKVSR